MKFLPSQLLAILKNRPERRNLQLLLKFSLFLVALTVVFTFFFHLIMLREDRTFSWITGLYWTLTVMSTLGFGDITFHSDMGRLFSILVLSSGMVLLLILFPFIFINFFYAPWMKARENAQVPRELPPTISGHIVLTKLDPVTEALIKKLEQFGHTYVVLVPDITEGLRLHGLGFNVMLGDLDDPDTYERVRVKQAALVATTSSDEVNTNVSFTVREISSEVPVISTCSYQVSVDILELAGSNHVLQLSDIMGSFFSRRASGGGASALVIGEFKELQIAEATVTNSSLSGQTIKETQLRERIGVNIVGIWERGKFNAAQPETVITENMVLVLAGSKEQIEAFNQHYANPVNESNPIIIIGGGRVGRATGRALAARGLDYRIVEKDPSRIKPTPHYIMGNAADIEVLQAAGINETSCVIITTHDDDVNVYLTIYCRRLRKDMQIITRSTLQRNLPTMHRAGADFVMSYAAMGSNTIFNLLKRSDILMVAEGLDLLQVTVPQPLAGRSIADSSIRQETGCTVIAVRDGDALHINPEPTVILPPGGEIILIGTVEAENNFFALYGTE
ncbi:potassium transporter TrkA [Rufibacter sp. DG15C]|uniref:potassium channel family protein n=1 Tax=Rufibacter sp. DG15C TaxID=1379909 RepID=UPI00078CC97B|nr:NAD-binding protein [Rufibacter sp. DG15C]AMM52135.1 potassium transporter TrkA [Rufibacter sp. DG15C]